MSKGCVKHSPEHFGLQRVHSESDKVDLVIPDVRFDVI